ncbi:MAG: hypothetical protein ABFC24_08935 [Methanoregulaceae archaeon]
MDRIMKITLGLFLVILAVFVSIGSYSLIINYAYKSSLSSTYSYSCSIATDTPLTNVTLFLPLPVKTSGSSPVVERIGGYNVSGIPRDWETVIYGDEQATFLKITTGRIGETSSTGSPENITFIVKVKSPDLINTGSPLLHDAVFRPVQDSHGTECPAVPANGTYTPSCSEYTTMLYARYDASETGTVTIHADLDAVNEWSIFHPDYNEYRNSFAAKLSGNVSGWMPASAWVESGIGSYDTPSR